MVLLTYNLDIINKENEMFSLAQSTVVVTSDSGDATGAVIFSGVYLFFWLVVALIAIIAYWKIFTKAGEAGWKSIIPFYNIYTLLKIIGRPGWWLLLFFVPFVNFVISLVVAIDLAKSFGKSDVFGVVALWLFSLVGFLMLGFGSAEYKGPSAAPAAQK